MSIHVTIRHIHHSLVQTFAALDTWFAKDVDLRRYRPLDGGWTVDEILEHVGLTNHFLLILIHKAARKALQNAQQQDLAAALVEQLFQEDKLAEIGKHKSFPWIRPEHMEPSGTKPLAEVRQQLKQQLQECLQTLDNLPNGEGILYKTTMSVNSLGKIDVYEYLYFLAQHGQRHLQQMARNEAEFHTSRL
ncbi:DinB family protein [Hymenobacter sp. J193]|uniref:DinB family protein n=1 Tax=Hymenobacter sp. J193 TaxID=2898429 RepID=UPI002151B1AA|nr:DinB family protein [Hymenobacter sp. J193]MCR5889370.1 DinB family protein [Hymenobacter sp. J193]